MDDKETQELADFTTEDIGLLQELKKRRDRSPPKIEVVSKDGKAISVAFEKGKDDLITYAKMMEATGVADRGVQSKMLGQVVETCQGQGKNFAAAANNCLALMHDISPQNALEGMLTVQMVGTHNLAMEMMRRAALGEQTVEGVERNINRATKLLRTFTAQTETLQKLRGKGQQKVTVEHVQVHKGGQAIVGNVEHRGGGD